MGSERLRRTRLGLKDLTDGSGQVGADFPILKRVEDLISEAEDPVLSGQIRTDVNQNLAEEKLNEADWLIATAFVENLSERHKLWESKLVPASRRSRRGLEKRLLDEINLLEEELERSKDFRKPNGLVSLINHARALRVELQRDIYVLEGLGGVNPSKFRLLYGVTAFAAVSYCVMVVLVLYYLS